MHFDKSCLLPRARFFYIVLKTIERDINELLSFAEKNDKITFSDEHEFILDLKQILETIAAWKEEFRQFCEEEADAR